ncbi:hypothetical protein Y1Q_0023521 [Alligator mississippiensis]|uniref:Uncharacterized protein n=1 Tax=Alligator mississippiensis TaxID=8496 RepID=A0A151NQU7_ALLMI|nr:hypothetical protein Y1Q_0023521 [Alligator mississippiensis]
MCKGPWSTVGFNSSLDICIKVIILAKCVNTFLMGMSRADCTIPRRVQPEPAQGELFSASSLFWDSLPLREG